MHRSVGWTTVAASVALPLAMGCGGESTEPPPPDPTPNRIVAVSGEGQTGTVGQQLPASLVVRVDDQSGDPMAGVAVSFSVTQGAGALSSTGGTTDGAGQVSTNWTLGTESGGQHQVQAAVSSTSLTVVFNATANPDVPIVISSDSGNNQVAYRGTRLPAMLVVRLRDQYANGVPNQLVQFVTESGNGTVDSAAAFTDASGRARTGWTLATTLGVQTARAVVDGLTGSPISFSATAHDLSITQVTPDPLRLGGVATIVGTGFDASPANNAVTVGGLAAVVNAATETQLDVTIPDECIPAGPVEVNVAVASFTSAPDTSDLMPDAFLQLAVGEQLVVENPAEFCLQFAEAAGTQEYLIGVQSTSETPSSLTPITVSGARPLGAAAVSAAALQASVPAVRTSGLLDRRRLERLARHRAAEAEIRELDRRNFEDLRLSQALQGASGAAGAIDPAAEVGDTVPVRVITESSCDQYAEVTTVVRAKGARGFFLEDVANPAGGYTTAEFDELSAQLDDLIYDTDVANFGAPLDQDANERLVVVVTKEVNIRGSLGFTSSCDFHARADAPASNEGEYFYQETPDPSGIHGEQVALQDAFALAPGILAHEFVHIIQFSQRALAGGPFPSIWIAEGQATLGEEVVGFTDEGRTTAQNYGFGIIANLDDTLSTDWYSSRLFDLGFYYGWNPDFDAQLLDQRLDEAPHECTWLAPPPDNDDPCINSRAVYGTPWSLLRWLTDQYGPSYPGGEQGFQQDLVHNTLSGYQLLESLTGESINTILARWAAMLYVDDLEDVGIGNPQLEMASWDLYDWFYGNYQLGGFVYSMWESARLLPKPVPFSSFTRSGSVRAGSTYYMLASGTDRTATAIQARDGSGGVLPNHMQLWVVRTK